MPAPAPPIAVLGAGLTGLSASLHLQTAGIPHRVYEKSSQVGGLATTVEDSGYRFDRTGHLLHLGDPDLRELVDDLIGDESTTVQRQARIWSQGTYTRYPYQANTFGLPPAVAYECLLGFLRAHFDAAGQKPSNFEEFCLLHFGDGFSRHFMLPYNERMWGVHPREITSEWCQRFVPKPRLEDVVAGAVGLSDRELGYNARFLYPKLGLGQLAASLARRIPAVELSRSPQRIDFRQRRLHFGNEVVPYRALVSTVPLPVLVGLLEQPPPAVVAAAEKLRCNALYYLDVALRAPCRQPWHWVYVPEAKYPFYRVGCYSHFSSAMAPDGMGSLYVELVERNPPDLSRLLPELAKHLVEMNLIASTDDIAFARARRLEHAYVVYDAAHAPARATIHSFLLESSILSTGRYGDWNYSSMEDALGFGRDAAVQTATLIS
jgi:protoporphyrinogen oxidase